MEPLIIAGLTMLAVAIGLGPFIHALHRREILDHPNERSSHSRPTPTGAGIVVLPMVILGWVALSATGYGALAIETVIIISALSLLLATVSWIDDVRALPALPRLIIHFLVAIAGVMLIPQAKPAFLGLVPQWLETPIIVVAWVWFINLFNFMDGIDGISAAEIIVVNIGIVVLSVFAPEIGTMQPYSLVLIGAALGFLFWNRPPARIFLGDVGSAPLGFLLGWQIMTMSGAGATAAALIIPGYYLADATLTVLRRLVRGEKIWHAHRDHFFQIAVRRGASHREVTVTVFLVGLCLSGVAILTTQGYTFLAIAIALVIIALTLTWFARMKPRHKNSPGDPVDDD
ncbi:MAG: glycosyltransferase family 4 protein [Rhodospirillales bacterium]